MTNINNLTNDTRNCLALGDYIISKDLHYSLESGTLHINELKIAPSTKDINKFYVFMIRVLNKDSKCLVYNYVSYPDVFYFTFMYFLCSRSKLMLNSIYREPGHFLSVIDKSLDSNPVEDKLSLAKTYFNLENFVDNIVKAYYSVTSIEILRLITRLVLQLDNQSMPRLVDLALKKDYVTFVEEILGSLDNYHIIDKIVSLDKNIEPFSIINGCVFIVKDLEKFIQNVRDIGYNLNAGPQSSKGQVNSINSSLSILDMEYRKSLYNHNNYHSNSGYASAPLKLNRDKFSFNNIHMNLGGVR